VAARRPLTRAGDASSVDSLAESDHEHDPRTPAPGAKPPDRGAPAPAVFAAAGNHAVARFALARDADAAGGAAAPTAAAAPADALIVDDGGPTPAAGQLAVSEFRSRLGAAAGGALADALGSSPWALVPARAELAQRLDGLAALDARAVQDELRRSVPGAAAATTADGLIAAARAEVARAAGEYAEERAASTGPDDQGSHPLATALSMAGALFKRRGGGRRGPGRLARLGRGRPLETGLAGRMGAALGHDFSDVRVHTDAQAGALSDSLDARAFTIGRDVAFSPGEYQPGTPVGDALIAHELAHVAQQRGAPAGEPMAKGPDGEAALEEEADVAAVHAVVALWTGQRSIAASVLPRLRSGLRLQRCGKTKPVPSSAPDIALDPQAIGQHVADGMKATALPTDADSGVQYAHNYKALYPDRFQEKWWGGYADEAYWDRPKSMEWHLKSGASASAAIKKWLAGLTIAECLSTVIALQTDAIRAAVGDKKFDEHFGGSDGPGSEGPLVVRAGWGGSSIEKYVKKTDAATKNDPGTPGHRPAKVGDRYYFYNHPKYLLKHPGGAWQGENSIYEGEEGGVQYWSGLGAVHKTEDDLLTAMKAAYDKPRTDRDREVLTQRHGTPDKWPAIYKEKKDGGTEFEDTVTKDQILNDPPYLLRGQTRKGGFVATAGREIDVDAVKGM
jgi:Domain of unknown function (DUF4157)/Protein-glutamine gamma-glutamyltransferase